TKRVDVPPPVRRVVGMPRWQSLAWLFAACVLAVAVVFEYRLQVIVDSLRARDPVVALSYARHETQDPDAFAAFASGRVSYLRLTEASLTQAIGFYEQAIALDPRYARAHAGIADCHVLRAVLGIGAPEVEYSQARVAVLRALELDPGLPAAHVSLAQIE